MESILSQPRRSSSSTFVLPVENFNRPQQNILLHHPHDFIHRKNYGYNPFIQTPTHVYYNDPMRVSNILIQKKLDIMESEDPFFKVVDIEPIFINIVSHGETVFIVNDLKQHSVVLRCYPIDPSSTQKPQHRWPCDLYAELNRKFCNSIDKSKCDLKRKVKDRYADITKECVIGENRLKFNCNKVPFILIIQYMDRVEVEDIVEVTKNTRQIEENEALELIKSQFVTDDDDELVEVLKKYSFIDPLMCTRITTPVRGTNCKHYDCFDLYSYLKMNERIRTWTCPICSKDCPFDTLVVDMFFTKILSQLGDSETNEVEIKPDGSWNIVVKEIKTRMKDKPEFLILDDLDDEEETDDPNCEEDNQEENSSNNNDSSNNNNNTSNHKEESEHQYYNIPQTLNNSLLNPSSNSSHHEMQRMIIPHDFNDFPNWDSEMLIPFQTPDMAGSQIMPIDID